VETGAEEAPAGGVEDLLAPRREVLIGHTGHPIKIERAFVLDKQLSAGKAEIKEKERSLWRS
jgi:hypothetical protein